MACRYGGHVPDRRDAYVAGIGKGRRMACWTVERLLCNTYTRGFRSVEKYDSEGNRLWEKNYADMIPDYGANPEGSYQAVHLAAVGSGGFYIVWTKDYQTYYLSRLDGDGRIVTKSGGGDWQVQLGLERVDNLVTDFEGNVYLGRNDGGHIFIVKYNADATLSWSRTYGPANVEASASTVEGRVIFSNQGLVIVGTVEFTTNAPRNLFVQKLDPNDGTDGWAGPTRLGDDLWDSESDVHAIGGVDAAMDSDGNVYVTGSDHVYLSTGDVLGSRPYWAKLNSTGEKVWEKRWQESFDIPGWRYSHPLSVEVDGFGFIYLASAGNASGIYPGSTNPDTGAFIAKYDGDGVLQWAAPVGLETTTDLSDLQLDARNNVFVSGATLPSGGSLYDYHYFVEKNPQGAQTFMTLTPAESRQVPGEQQTLEALVMHNGLPAAGVTVDFTVSGGPNAGTGGSAVTDDTGTASFTFGGTPGVGIDTVRATATVDVSQLAATASVEWKKRQIDLVVVKGGLYEGSPISDTTKVKIGESVSFTLVVTNNGPDTATGVKAWDIWPANLEYQSYSASQGSCSFTVFGSLECLLGNLPSGASATVTIIGKAIGVGAIGNHGGANIDDSSQQEDTDLQNDDSNVVSFAVEKRQIDLAVVKAGLYGDSPIDETTKVKIGESLSFTLLVSNNGPDTATAVRVEDNWPAELEYQSSSASQGTCTFYTGEGLECILGDLPSGASASVTIMGKAITGGTVGNRAGVEHLYFDEQEDTDSLNDTSTLGFTVEKRKVDLSMTMTTSLAENAEPVSGNTPVFPGEMVRFLVRVQNSGPDTADGVMIRDTLGEGFAYESSYSPQVTCNYDSGQRILACAVGSLVPVQDGGGAPWVSVTARAVSAGTGINAATIDFDAATHEDTQPANNSVSVALKILEKIKGDFNADGEVTVIDAIQGLKIVTGVGQEGGREAAFDATCDGRVGSGDVSLILGVIAGTREPPTSCP